MGLVEDGQLDATVEDLPIYIFYGPDFPGLHHVGELLAPGYYVGYVRKGDDSLRLALNSAIESAIADGTLERLYEKYGIWNDDQRELTEVAKNWPPAVDAAASRWANFGHYTWMLLRAAWTTILLSFLSMPLAIALGLAVAIGRLYGPAWVRIPCEAYVELLRGTPLLLQLFVIYYVLPNLTGVTPARVLGWRVGFGGQLLRLRSRELSGWPARHSARSDGSRPGARHDHAHGAAPGDHPAGGPHRDPAGDQ